MFFKYFNSIMRKLLNYTVLGTVEFSRGEKEENNREVIKLGRA